MTLPCLAVFSSVALLLWVASCFPVVVVASIQVVVDVERVYIPRDKTKTKTDTDSDTDTVLRYRVINERNETLFEGGDLAVFAEGHWCVAPSDPHGRSLQHEHRNLAVTKRETIRGRTPGLGPFTGTRIEWVCNSNSNGNGNDPNTNQSLVANRSIVIVTSFRNYESRRAVVFDIAFPRGLKNTSLPNFYGEGSESDRGTDTGTGSLAAFPSFVMTSAEKKAPGSFSDANANANANANAPTNTDSCFPPVLPSALSWEGSFVQSVRRPSVGPRGGPTVFYNASDPALTTVIVASPFVPTTPPAAATAAASAPRPPYLRHRFNQFTAGNQRDWTRTVPSFAPGLNGRLRSVPAGLAHSILLYQGSRGGITATMDEWGTIVQAAVQSLSRQGSVSVSSGPDANENENANATGISKSTANGLVTRPTTTSGNSNSNFDSHRVPKLRDVTLEKIGYQTDNGAMYCFCNQANCSEVLLREKEYLDSIGIPIGYLSFQGAGTSSGRGKAAPWCVERWSADGGQDPGTYPLDTGNFQRALGVPLQLYAPYFCPNTTEYFRPNTPWESVSSNPSLPGCKGFAFDTVAAADSKDFFAWFLAKGIERAGMVSFESDFMDQNINCVDDFVEDALWGADGFLGGMADAALDRNTPIQWCYASPNVVMSSLDFPAVTNFRVSFDFCYGRSYDIGESSLLVWALGAAPSKDTLWTTDNNRTETPGCKWTVDHEAVAAELHVVLAIMTTGPVGISDAIGMTNATLLRRIISKDGSLLQPSKPITAVDASFLQDSKLDGYLYGTFGLGPSWIFVSFQLRESFPVTLRDFWPRIEIEPGLTSIRLVYRTFASSPDCRDGANAVESGCVAMVPLRAQNEEDESEGRSGESSLIFVASSSSFEFPGSDLSPDVVTVWQECPQSGVFFLGELDKYVALSPKRFQSVTCTKQGVSAVIQGSAGEIIEVTLLVPHPTESYRHQVVKESFVIANHGAPIRFDFPTNDAIQSTNTVVA